MFIETTHGKYRATPVGVVFSSHQHIFYTHAMPPASLLRQSLLFNEYPLSNINPQSIQKDIRP